MVVHKITKGLDLPIAGQPIQIIRETLLPTRVAVMADDFPGIKPGMFVEEGETVKRGQPLFEDRKASGVVHTAPGAGRIIGIHRGARRVLQSVVIDLSDNERAGAPPDAERVHFESYKGAEPSALSRDDVVALLVESGLWTALRTRPFSKVPATDTAPAALFVNAMDTNPLAPLPEVALMGEEESFNRGLSVLSKLTEGNTYLCSDPDSAIESWVDAPVTLERFSGPHPAGTTGLHIHLVEPVGRAKTVWHIGYQDVVSVGKLFANGKLDVDRVISVAGPLVEDPRLVRTRLGACADEVTGNGFASEARVISGSVLSGKKSMGDAFGFMGRYDLQISVIREGREREFMGWLDPGLNKFSTIPIYLSRLFSGKRFDFTTATNGSPRAMVPIGMYERVMPMDILPTFLLRSMLVGDIERAEELGALELDEEDLALCTFVDPGKTDFGPVLRRNLEMIEKEG